MSTTLINDAGDVIALRFYGGSARGPLIDVAMPKSIAEMVSLMPVAEETSPDLRTTLGLWIADQVTAGYTVRYGTGVLDPMRMAA